MRADERAAHSGRRSAHRSPGWPWRHSARTRHVHRARSLRDRHELHKIIEAISILGGEEADAYLSFLAGSHDDEEIRGEAAAARARLLRRADAGNPL